MELNSLFTSYQLISPAQQRTDYLNFYSPNLLNFRTRVITSCSDTRNFLTPFKIPLFIQTMKITRPGPDLERH